jgi:hypothetical protein
MPIVGGHWCVKCFVHFFLRWSQTMDHRTWPINENQLALPWFQDNDTLLVSFAFRSWIITDLQKNFNENTFLSHRLFVRRPGQDEALVLALLGGLVTGHIVRQSITVLRYHVVVVIGTQNAHSLVQRRYLKQNVHFSSFSFWLAILLL